MTDTAAIESAALFSQDFTGPNSASTGAVSEASLCSYADGARHALWFDAYTALVRPVYYGSGSHSVGLAYFHTATASLEFRTEALPVAPSMGRSEALESLKTIERTFSSSASDLSKILHVSRQMIYHYRKGMEPEHENFRRIRLIASFAEGISLDPPISLEPVLKLPQPEGDTLMAYLSEKTPDASVLRRILLRVSADLDKRRRLADLLGYATPHDRQDVMRNKHARGKPIYVSDPDMPGRIVQIRPDQSRVRGRMINRVFVPDEE